MTTAMTVARINVCTTRLMCWYARNDSTDQRSSTKSKKPICYLRPFDWPHCRRRVTQSLPTRNPGEPLLAALRGSEGSKADVSDRRQRVLRGGRQLRSGGQYLGAGRRRGQFVVHALHHGDVGRAGSGGCRRERIGRGRRSHWILGLLLLRQRPVQRGRGCWAGT